MFDTMESVKHVYEIRSSKYRGTFDLISNVLPFGRSGGYLAVTSAVRQAKSYSGSHPAVIRIYDDADNEHGGDFKDW
jgi:hypothetical protein